MNLFDEKLDKPEEFFKDWEYISDQVMGGVSTGKAEVISSSKSFLRLSGKVSTKNNGGFIQVRSNKKVLIENLEGIQLKVKGIPVFTMFIFGQPLFISMAILSGKFSVEKD